MTRRTLLALPFAPVAAGAEIVSVERIWDQAPHSAFTDLVLHRGRFLCAFREARTHVSGDGVIRVLSSKDAVRWESVAVLKNETGDLRDPKLAIAANGQIMLTTAVVSGEPKRLDSLVYLSTDGRQWSRPHTIGDTDVWVWRVNWRGKKEALAIGYSASKDRFARLYRTTDGSRFETLVPRLYENGYPNETSILYDSDGRALCLMRRDEGDKIGLLGESRPPYKDWSWKPLGARIGGPHMIRVPGGKLVAAVRLYDGKTRTSLCWIHEGPGRLEEFLPLPSGGDTSYAGLVWHKGLLYVSYYSSHESKTNIYLAKVRLT